MSEDGGSSNDTPQPAAEQPAWPYPFPPEEWEQVPPGVRAYVVLLQQRLEQLEARLNRTSKNSNQPPSADSPFHKPTAPEKKSRGKPGGRKGHKGHRHAFLTPTHVVDYLPGCCPCGETHIADLEVYYIHQQVELPEVKPDVTHHRLHKGTCVTCGRTVQASQKEIPATERSGFGPRLTGFVALMAGILGASRRDIQRLLGDVFAIPTSLGGIPKTLDRASDAVKPHHETIAEIARSAPVNHIDETSWRSQNRLRWLWVMTNKAVAFFRLLPGRSKKDFETLIDAWTGILAWIPTEGCPVNVAPPKFCANPPSHQAGRYPISRHIHQSPHSLSAAAWGRLVCGMPRTAQFVAECGQTMIFAAVGS